jgi:hypothetical protein
VSATVLAERVEREAPIGCFRANLIDFSLSTVLPALPWACSSCPGTPQLGDEDS